MGASSLPRTALQQRATASAAKYSARSSARNPSTNAARPAHLHKELLPGAVHRTAQAQRRLGWPSARRPSLAKNRGRQGLKVRPHLLTFGQSKKSLQVPYIAKWPKQEISRCPAGSRES